MRGRLFVTGASALTLFCASALDIVWDLCPDDTPEHPSGDDCASVTLPLHPGSPELGDVTSFVRRFYPDSGPTGKSIWMIQGGPGYSSVGFAPIAEYWTQTGNTVYLMDARGVGLSSLLYCDVALQLPPFDTEDPDVIELFKTCHDQLAVKYGSVAQYFDTRHAALDMKSVIDAVNPDTVSIYATSVGAHYANVYMQLPGARVNAVILDSPVTTNRWKVRQACDVLAVIFT
jgi:pimeloyl-ACP methyl ester carboxylesterase